MKTLSPKETVRAVCIDCLGLIRWDRKEVENCKGDTCKTGPCPLYPYRLGERISVKVFRQFCIQCQGGQPRFVADCPSTDCKVYPYRFGKNPAHQGKGSNFSQKGRESMKIERESTIASQTIPQTIDYNLILKTGAIRNGAL